MATEIQPNLYKIDVPLPNNLLRSLNTYLIKNDHRNLLVDTGFNQPECKQVLFAQLKGLDINLAKTDVFITHMHPDHSGLVLELVRAGARAFCSREDAKMINTENVSGFFLSFITMCGFPTVPQSESRSHTGYSLYLGEEVDFTYVEDGDKLTYGEYSFTAIKTPGHSAGHMCLYDEQKELLIAGDHILADITPNISLWSHSSDPLQDFIINLKRVGQLKIRLALPGHRSLITDCHGRIRELLEYHRIRAHEVIEIVSNAKKTPYEVAQQMKWDVRNKTFEEFPFPQKLFATGEALAHLKYLETHGHVQKENCDGIYRYSATSLLN